MATTRAEIIIYGRTHLNILKLLGGLYNLILYIAAQKDIFLFSHCGSLNSINSSHAQISH